MTGPDGADPHDPHDPYDPHESDVEEALALVRAAREDSGAGAPYATGRRGPYPDRSHQDHTSADRTAPDRRSPDRSRSGSAAPRTDPACPPGNGDGAPARPRAAHAPPPQPPDDDLPFTFTPNPDPPAPHRTTPETTSHHGHGQGPTHAYPHTPWPRARTLARRAGERVVARGSRPVENLSLDESAGRVLAAPIAALTDLPPFDTSAMDGWAVAGPGPWTLRQEELLAGLAQPEPLADGEAVAIATGARVPYDATAVIRSEHGHRDAHGRLHQRREVAHGQDIRPRGQECRSGDHLLAAGALITPAAIGLAAAAGYDTLSTVARPTAEVLVVGDELLTSGLPRDGLIRDALGPMLPSWLRSLGAEVVAVRRVGDDARALHRAVTASRADLVLTTGGTASGPVDHVHPTLDRIGAELLVDGVEVRPGHPMLLARLDGTRHLVGLPGNPLAAASGLLTLAEPLLRTLAGRVTGDPYLAPTRDVVHGHPHDTRLVPVALRGDHAVPLHYNGPAMLRSIAVADGIAVVEPGGARPGQELEILDLPWAWSPEECFT